MVGIICLHMTLADTSVEAGSLNTVGRDSGRAGGGRGRIRWYTSSLLLLLSPALSSGLQFLEEARSHIKNIHRHKYFKILVRSYFEELVGGKMLRQLTLSYSFLAASYSIRSICV